jgi:hypothetical protein
MTVRCQLCRSDGLNKEIKGVVVFVLFDDFFVSNAIAYETTVCPLYADYIGVGTIKDAL